MWDDIGKLIGGVAPTLATALGGPLAGAAVHTIAEALGVDVPPKFTSDSSFVGRLRDAIGGATPEQRAAIIKAEHDFEARMRELDIDLARLHAEDRQSARQAFTRHRSFLVPAIAVMVMLAFFATVGGVLFGVPGLAAEHSVLAGTVVGYVSAKADQVVSFFFGSSEAADQVLKGNGKGKA